MPTLGAVFSDIDGTVVHYKPKLVAHLGYEYLGPVDPPRLHAASQLPIEAFRHTASGEVVDVVPVPSATLGGGYMSVDTIDLVAELRKRGVLFVLITGARTSTFHERVRSGTLPPIDYGINEGGGRIWDGATLAHHDEWTDRFASVCGPWREQETMECAEKQGPIWDVYRRLMAADALGPGTGNVKLDGRSYVTSFMADVRGDTSAHPTLGVATVTDKETTLRRLTEEEFGPKHSLSMVVNLGKAQFAPIGVDKRTAMEYVAAREGITLGHRLDAQSSEQGPDAAEADSIRYAAALFDDDNDLGFAARCSLGFAPTIAHPSVRDAMNDFGPMFNHTPIEGFIGTNHALRQLLRHAPAA